MGKLLYYNYNKFVINVYLFLYICFVTTIHVVGGLIDKFHKKYNERKPFDFEILLIFVREFNAS